MKCNRHTFSALLALCLVCTACVKLNTVQVEATCHSKVLHKPLQENQAVFIKRVVDGDTYVGCVLPEGTDEVRLRLLGVDCPESKANRKCARDAANGKLSCEAQVPLGQKAKRIVSDRLLHQVARIQSGNAKGIFKTDVFGRTLAYVQLPNQTDLGLTLIQEGLCWDYGAKYPHPRMQMYREAMPHN